MLARWVLAAVVVLYLWITVLSVLWLYSLV